MSIFKNNKVQIGVLALGIAAIAFISWNFSNANNGLSDASFTPPITLSTPQWGTIGGTLSSQTDLQTALNGKATIASTLAGYGITNAYPLTGNPSGFLSSVPAQSFASLTGKPTTLSGYGITDAYPLSSNPASYLTSATLSGYATTSALTSALATKANMATTLSGYGITDGVSISGSYSNPSWITSLAYSKLTGTPTIPTLVSQLTNDTGFITSSALTGYATTSALTTGLGTKANTATTLAGYGITDAYPLVGNPSGFLTGITSSQVATALGFTPYNGTTNPNSYITTAGARSAFTLTTTGTSGAATLNTSTGALNIPNYAFSGVTAVTGTAPIVSSGGTTPALSIPVATSSANGYLSSTDWVTFNNKLTAAVTSVGLTSSDLTISGSPVTTSGNITANLNLSGITAGTYDSLTVNSKGIATAGANPTFNNAVVRTLATNYTISTTQNARVYYTVRIAYTVTVLVGSTGSMSLQYSTNAGSTWNTVSTVSNNLNLGLALTGYNDFILSGEIPANALVRITSTTTNATDTYQTGQEVLLP